MRGNGKELVIMYMKVVNHLRNRQLWIGEHNDHKQ